MGKSELLIPESVQKSRHATELLRVWIAEGDQHVSILTDVWEDPAAWGLVLADLARHISSAYAMSQGRDPEVVLRRIAAGLAAELKFPTDIPTGTIRS